MSEDKFPDGLDKDKVKKAKKTALAIIKNYKKFIELKKNIKQKKDAGKELTDEEKVIEPIDTYKKMQNWLTAAKKKEGIILGTAGQTDVYGEKTSTTKEKPKNAYEEFEEYLTLEIHEPSHQEALKKLAKECGLDWERWQKYGELNKKLEKEKNEGKPSSLTEEELKLILGVLIARLDENSPESKFLKKLNEKTLEEHALEEIGEYEEENKVRDRFLNQLTSKTEKTKKVGFYKKIGIGVGISIGIGILISVLVYTCTIPCEAIELIDKQNFYAMYNK